MVSKPLILHVSADFPDTVEPFKTKVVETLLDLTDDKFHHQVVSLNRVTPSSMDFLREVISPPPIKVEEQPFERGIAVSYEAPSKGVRHLTKLQQLGDWLAEHIRKMSQRPALLVGHKLAVEGLAVRRAAQALDIPYALSIQGDSDTKIMSIRRDLHNEFRSVLHGAEVVFPFTPWAWDFVTKRLGVPDKEPIMLPCPTDLDQPIAPRMNGDGLISIFHLQSYKRKNLAVLVKASGILRAKGHDVPLSVIGGGTDRERATCEALAKEVPSVTLAGAMGRKELLARMRRASGFVLPSLRESFGLVFVEALFAGLPIIYPQDTAVDGYFDGAPFALKVDARDPQDVADAMRSLMENEAAMKQALAKWQTSDEAKRFQRPAIAADFARGLNLASSKAGLQ
jgi:glycosyltransferase involved in cell wall biosynthesis